MSEPDIFFIVPYRDREAQLELFMNQNKIILEGINYQILISHQCDRRPFNRGALKNLGFLYIKKKYPKTYKDKTLVFSDVDCVFWKKGILKWKTTHGRIKHFYGTNPKKSAALGGLFSITAGDFEKTNGFPNYWGWGFEDNIIYKRALKHNIKINRDNFYPIGSNKILHFSDQIVKYIDKNNLNNQFKKNYQEKDNLNTLTNIKYHYDKNTNFLNISNFKSLYDENKFDVYAHNTILSGPKIKNQNNKKLLFS